MLTPAERFRGWIDSLGELWKDRLRGWMASWAMEGLTRLFDAFEPDLREEIRPSIQRLLEIEELPDDLRAILTKAIEAPSFIQFAAILPYLIAIMMGLGLGMAMPGMRVGSYQVDKLMSSFRLDPMSVITAWRRDPATYEKLFSDLKDQGWSDEKIEALKFYTLFLPTADEQTTWLAKEVYEPDMIAKYGLDDEMPVYEQTDFSKVGVNPEQMRNKWRAHWVHATWMQVVEMLHRGLLTEEDVWIWFRVVEIPPYWRQLLIDTAYTWPTRVDVRRWWDMRTIDETELRRLYSGMGYRDVNLDNYVLWTKVYVAFPDLMARWSKGWITLDDVRRELTALGMPIERLEEFIQMKVKPGQAERTSGDRDLTKTDIIKGVKTGVITRGEGIELLMDLGYDEDEATYILEINIPRDEEDVVVKQRELTKADILTGLKTAIITEEEAQTRLVEIRYKPDDARTILNIFKAAAEPPIEAWQREASKADIVAAVKKGLITPENAYLMLLDIGFSAEAANFILMVRAEVSPFSPISYNEFKDITTKYKIAVGREAKPMPEELIKAGEEVVRLTGEVEALQQAIKEEERGLIPGKVLPKAATKKRDELRVALHRAEAELAMKQADYDAKVAEWKHGLP